MSAPDSAQSNPAEVCANPGVCQPAPTEPARHDVARKHLRHVARGLRLSVACGRYSASIHPPADCRARRLAELNSDYANLLSASTKRNQLISGFEQA